MSNRKEEYDKSMVNSDITSRFAIPIDRKKKEDFTKNVNYVLKNNRWYWWLISLAWTAGPVTYLALQGGHYLSFGKPPPNESFIYFAGYTLIAGILAAIVQFVRLVIIEPNKKKAKRDLRNAIDRLFLLYFAARNELLKSYEDEDRAVVAAWWTFRSATTEIEVLEEAIRDVSKDDELAHALKRIEFYRKQGFVTLMNMEYQNNIAKISALIDEIAPKFPSLSVLIEQRFRGICPKASYGQPRPDGFIERLISAEEQGRYELATGDDVLSAFMITIELLLGRVIIALYPEFHGHKQLEEAKEKFDEILSDFRLQLRKRNGRMSALVMDLCQDNHNDTEQLQTLGASSKQLKEMLINSIHNHGSDKYGQKRYNQIISINNKLNRLWHKLSSCERDYNNLWQKEGHKLQQRFSEESSSGKSEVVISISEHEISLTEKQKIKLARDIHNLLDNITIRRRSLIGLAETDDGLERMGLDDYKGIAINLLDILDDIIDISEHEEQLAIESSREADFGCIEPSLTSTTKKRWAEIMVTEVQQNRVQVAHRLAASLVRYLNMPIGEAMKEYLIKEYGASREYLEQLQSEEFIKPNIASNSLKNELFNLPKWDDI